MLSAVGTYVCIILIFRGFSMENLVSGSKGRPARRASFLAVRVPQQEIMGQGNWQGLKNLIGEIDRSCLQHDV